MNSETPDTTGALPSLGFIGGGHMAAAIVRGLLRDGYPADQIVVSDPSAERIETLAKAFEGVQLTHDNAVVVASAEVVVLAVKPQVLPQVCRQLRMGDDAHRLWLSIAAGIGSQAIVQWLDIDAPVIRAMPNQGAALGLSATGLFANAACTATDRERATQIMAAIGATHWVAEERLIDAVTALAGSGPAYVYLLLEAMQQAGESLQLAPEMARSMAVQTATAAAAIAAAGEPLQQLRAQVTSPGGTTAAAIDYLQDQQFAATIGGAIDKAYARAQALAQAANEEN